MSLKEEDRRITKEPSLCYKKMKIKQLRKNSDYLVLKQWCLTICDYLLSINSDYSEIVNGEYGFLSILKEIDKTHNLTIVR